MPTVRTTIQPHVELEVGDAEYLDLQRQGILIEESEPARTAAAAPAKTPATAKKDEGAK